MESTAAYNYNRITHGKLKIKLGYLSMRNAILATIIIECKTTFRIDYYIFTIVLS